MKASELMSLISQPYGKKTTISLPYNLSAPWGLVDDGFVSLITLFYFFISRAHRKKHENVKHLNNIWLLYLVNLFTN